MEPPQEGALHGTGPDGREAQQGGGYVSIQRTASWWGGRRWGLSKRSEEGGEGEGKGRRKGGKEGEREGGRE